MAEQMSGLPVEHLGEVVVVTGMTGAGRSTAAKELEDLGFFVVDNLPPELVGDVVRLIDDNGRKFVRKILRWNGKSYH